MKHHDHSHYKYLAIELVIDGIIMFFVMYAMVDTTAHIHLNSNNFYMTLMMVAPMGLVMMLAMRSMFHNQKLNATLYALFIIVFSVSFYAMRTQALVGDEQFLRAMIPHHSGAILMCENASLTDPEIKALCEKIIQGQAEEIAQMEEILKRY